MQPGAEVIWGRTISSLPVSSRSERLEPDSLYVLYGRRTRISRHKLKEESFKKDILAIRTERHWNRLPTEGA